MAKFPARGPGSALPAPRSGKTGAVFSAGFARTIYRGEMAHNDQTEVYDTDGSLSARDFAALADYVHRGGEAEKSFDDLFDDGAFGANQTTFARAAHTHTPRGHTFYAGAVRTTEAGGSADFNTPVFNVSRVAFAAPTRRVQPPVYYHPAPGAKYAHVSARGAAGPPPAARAAPAQPTGPSARTFNFAG